jgi:hypothetical protein
MPELLAPGQAKLVKAGSDLVFQLHYTTDGRPGCDHSRIGLVLSHEPPHQRVLMLAAANVHFLIPAGDPDYEVDARVTLHAEATLVTTGSFRIIWPLRCAFRPEAAFNAPRTSTISAANPVNPDATKAVRFGPQSWDEMMIGYFEVATDLKNGLRELLLPGQTITAGRRM